jgi:hypothetical protein
MLVSPSGVFIRVPVRKQLGRALGRAVVEEVRLVSTSFMHALIKRSENHREHSAERTVKSPDRVVLDLGGHPRVSKLQQQCPTGSEKDCTPPIDLPCERPRPEYTLSGSSCCRAHLLQFTFQAFRRADYL